jgi:hypothetical protein
VKLTGKSGDPVRRNGRKVQVSVLAAIRCDANGTLSDADRRTVERFLPGILASAAKRRGAQDSRPASGPRAEAGKADAGRQAAE